MKISSFGYNIAKVSISQFLVAGTRTKVGTKDDFKALLALASTSGVIRVEAVIGTQYMNGALIANPYEDGDGIEAYTISSAGSASPYIVHAAIELGDDGTYVTVNLIPLS